MLNRCTVSFCIRRSMDAQRALDVADGAGIDKLALEFRALGVARQGIFLGDAHGLAVSRALFALALRNASSPNSSV